jgi:FtsP/CotA-like multicopper oxidase with cupredoxin domain
MLAGITIQFSGATLTTVELDGGNSVSPKRVSALGVVYPGQRSDVILQWKASSIATLRIELEADAFRYVNHALQPSQEFTIHLDTPIGGMDLQTHELIHVPQKQADELPRPVAHDADTILVLYTKTLKLSHLSNIPHGFMNQTSWKPQSPPLIDLKRSSYDSSQFVPFIPLTEPALWVDIVLNNLDEDDHPFHLHGHDAYVLQSHTSARVAQSWNPFQGRDPPGGPLDLDHPVLRDTFMVPRRGYIVLRFKADNPGIWMFHCHVLWHQASGMAMGIQIRESAT